MITRVSLLPSPLPAAERNIIPLRISRRNDVDGRNSRSGIDRFTENQDEGMAEAGHCSYRSAYVKVIRVWCAQSQFINWFLHTRVIHRCRQASLASSSFVRSFNRSFRERKIVFARFLLRGRSTRIDANVWETSATAKCSRNALAGIAQRIRVTRDEEKAEENSSAGKHRENCACTVQSGRLRGDLCQFGCCRCIQVRDEEIQRYGERGSIGGECEMEARENEESAERET